MGCNSILCTTRNYILEVQLHKFRPGLMRVTYKYVSASRSGNDPTNRTAPASCPGTALAAEWRMNARGYGYGFL